ncbi:hypothetical protein LX32DRAFT_644612 [Colletotrichum zoysiae]|uniref:Uncharacterized protein n=1 Tax=Colletotrichum zoysiae TaxID=1216348 RepID=A0AAD9H7Z1_9PEZI|nr:hypothetical protein LX32DRAFT_644612 [Colletotrichum zoysiae]
MSTWAMLTKMRLQGSRIGKETNGSCRLPILPTDDISPSKSRIMPGIYRDALVQRRLVWRGLVGCVSQPLFAPSFAVTSEGMFSAIPNNAACRPRKRPDTGSASGPHCSMHTGPGTCCCLSPEPRQKQLPISGQHIEESHAILRRGGPVNVKESCLVDAAALNLGGAIR